MSVKPEAYGIREDEFMLMTDKEISGLMPLKKLAPYKKEVHINTAVVNSKKRRITKELAKRKVHEDTHSCRKKLNRL